MHLAWCLNENKVPKSINRVSGRASRGRQKPTQPGCLPSWSNSSFGSCPAVEGKGKRLKGTQSRENPKLFGSSLVCPTKRANSRSGHKLPSARSADR